MIARSRTFLHFLCSLCLLSSSGGALSESYFDGYFDQDKKYSNEFSDILNSLDSEKKRSLFEKSHEMAAQEIGYDLYNRNGKLSCTGFINKVFEETNQHWGFEISTHVTHGNSPYVNEKSSRQEGWASSEYLALKEHFDVYEKEIVTDNLNRVIRVENPGFRPEKGDILTFPSRHLRKNDKYYSTGHMLVVVDPENCVAVHSTSWTYDYEKYRRDVSKQGVMFHKVVRDDRCKDGVWSAWDNSERNKFWTLLRPKSYLRDQLALDADISEDPAEPIVTVDSTEEPNSSTNQEPDTGVNDVSDDDTISLLGEPVPAQDAEPSGDDGAVGSLDDLDYEPSVVEEPLPVPGMVGPGVTVPLFPLPEASKETNHLLAVGETETIIAFNRVNGLLGICGELDPNTILQVQEGSDDILLSVKVAFGEQKAEFSCDNSFYILKNQAKIFNYLSSDNSLKLNPFNVTRKLVMYHSPSHSSSVAGFLSPGEEVVALKHVTREGAVWMLVNKNLSWVKLEF